VRTAEACQEVQNFEDDVFLNLVVLSAEREGEVEEFVAD
jgi:hypothetical protein